MCSGNSQDVYDLSWSPDSRFIMSGSMEKFAMMFDVVKGCKMPGDMGPHQHNVQGVAWDTRNQVLCTLSSDRGLRVFSRRKPGQKAYLAVTHMEPPSPPSAAPCEPVATAAAAPAEVEKKSALQQRLFADETVPTFFRRLAWSPDGSFLVVPCGIYKDCTGHLKSVAHVFSRTNLDKPALCLPTYADGGKTGQDPAVAVRFNPHLYKLSAASETDDQSQASDFFRLPYRVVFAVASLHSIAVYDTSSVRPIAIVHGLHCAAITDLSWSTDGKTLAVSSHDGFCSMIRFKSGELGEKLDKADLPECMTDEFVTAQIKAFEEKPKKAKAPTTAVLPTEAAVACSTTAAAVASASVKPQSIP
eukprot:COSAG05_NODE_56_length_23335_cov_15.221338_25_plen_359_part_00